MATTTKAKPVETQLANAVLINREKIWIAEQPREYFAPESMAELRESIREHGILQPLVVAYEPSRYDGRPYKLLAGERRFRASETVLTDLPCIIQSKSQSSRLITLVENLQREDLTAIEEAKGVRELMEVEGWSARATAKELKKSMGWISKRLDLLKTGEDIQAVAARNPLVMSSLLLIDDVKEKETRAELLEQVEKGASHSVIKNQVERIKSEKLVAKQIESESHRAPDKQTQTRLNQVASNGHGTMSRGVLVTGTKPSDAKQVIETALLRMETDFKSLSNFYQSAPPSARNAAKKRLYELSKKFGELL